MECEIQLVGSPTSRKTLVAESVVVAAQIYCSQVVLPEDGWLLVESPTEPYYTQFQIKNRSLLTLDQEVIVQTPAVTEAVEPQRPDMPGCLVVWLVLGIILNSIVSLLLFSMSSIGGPHYYNPNHSLQFIGGLVSIGAVICAIAVLRWRMWGVIGFCICNGIGAVVCVAADKTPISAIGGIVGIAVFLALVNAGKQKPIQYMK